MALTLIKVLLNKSKVENNHFCLTGKMARYVAEAMTTHAPLAKHMFFRSELCAGLVHAALRCCPRVAVHRTLRAAARAKQIAIINIPFHLKLSLSRITCSLDTLRGYLFTTDNNRCVFILHNF